MCVWCVCVLLCAGGQRGTLQSAERRWTPCGGDCRALGRARAQPWLLVSLVVSLPSVRGRVPSVSLSSPLFSQRLRGGLWQSPMRPVEEALVPCSGVFALPPGPFPGAPVLSPRGRLEPLLPLLAAALGPPLPCLSAPPPARSPWGTPPLLKGFRCLILSPELRLVQIDSVALSLPACQSVGPTLGGGRLPLAWGGSQPAPSSRTCPPEDTRGGRTTAFSSGTRALSLWDPGWATTWSQSSRGDTPRDPDTPSLRALLDWREQPHVWASPRASLSPTPGPQHRG